jgi:ABC-type uncharacterized transport system involved in gliding motility auxiliary subunit
MLQDYLWVRQQNFFGQRVAQAWAHNGDLILNAIDNLAGSTDLISVRGRSTFTRPFERVEAIRRNAEERFRATEKQLEQELNSTEEKLATLQTKRNDDSSLILSPEQAQEIERFQAEKLNIRKQLRDVRLGLNQDIDRLGKTLLILNVVLVPALLSIGALALYLMRRRRRSTVVAAGKEAGA